MCVYFIARLLTGFIASALADVQGNMSPVLSGFLHYSYVITLSYIIPIIFTVILFRYKVPVRTLYKKPSRVARALGVFPAAYGLGYGVALVTLLVSYIISSSFSGETTIEQLLRPTTVGGASSIAELVMMVILLVVVAPIFEEYLVRGVMFDALRPYGAGIAILISSILFGLMHGSLYMLFYTTALGLALGYIRYATGSLFIVTILHAMINSVSATILFLSSLVNITGREYRVLNTIELLFSVSALILIVIGIAVFIAKIPTIRRYRFENPWPVIGPWKKLGVFTASIPVLISLVLAFNELSGQWLLNLIIP